MSRREVIEITCDRCGRTETQSSTEIPKSGSPEMDYTFHGVRVTFNDLCRRCRDAVTGYIARITRKMDDAVAVPPEETKDEPKKRGFLGGK